MIGAVSFVIKDIDLPNVYTTVTTAASAISGFALENFLPFRCFFRAWSNEQYYALDLIGTITLPVFVAAFIVGSAKWFCPLVPQRVFGYDLAPDNQKHDPRVTFQL